MSKLTKIVVLTVLFLWSLAAMHCKLEALPGFDFLRSCCFLDVAASSEKDCDRDGCGAVEEGSYRLEEQPLSAPKPLFLMLAWLLPPIETPRVELRVAHVAHPKAPPELPRLWRFAQRAALLPRAPSLVG